ncbi:MAG: hypothetical protein NTY55_02475 [Flavobacteriia bacterium]|nr:hypothetical protein [Flavobacteriia bacterium]
MATIKTTCPKGQTWDPKKLKCVKLNTELITNNKSGTSYFASPEGTVYGTGKNSQISIDTTGYSGGKKDFNLKTTNSSGTTKKLIKKKDVIPLLNNIKKEVKSGVKKKGGAVKTKKKK